MKQLIENLEKLTNKKVILTEELTPFLAKLKAQILDYKNIGKLKWWSLKKLNTWPEIEYGEGGYSPEESRKKGIEISKEKADIENFEVINLTPKELVVSAGGDWQYPYVITIKLVDGKLKVINSGLMEKVINLVK